MHRRKSLSFLCAVLGATWGAGAASAQDAGEAHEHHHEHGADAKGDHDHPAPEKSSDYVVSSARYEAPKISLIDQNNRKVRIDQLLSEDRPTLVQFIFTSCTTICPVMGAVFGGAQNDIAAVAPNYRMVSISIDPEYDTPEKLREFAAKQNARPDWVFLTGAADDITKVTKSFDALNQGDNKMYHQPFTFIRWRKDGEWVRIRGLLSVADLVSEFSSARKVETP
ncbi:MAG: hypothetical protein A3E78_12985 [Alphaproteobacteria bacterium RIFCSPHIGHO2_12_FULL_63_12]|nr:MAG: hypothetical protein A3E78_12985 [Alphaproteobacteria bacterium RIFCSPHIGHO2_12_FULL_63_12]